MDKIILIIRHAFVAFISGIIIFIIGFLFKFYLVHNLIDATFSLGIFALGISMIEFISPFSSFGFGAVATRYIPKWNVNNNVKKINNFITFIGMFSLILSCLYAISLYLNQENIFAMLNIEVNQKEFITFLSFLPFFLILMIVKNITSIINQFLIGFQEVKKTVVFSELIGFPLKFILVIFFIYFEFDFKGYLYAEIISSGFILFAFIYILKNIISENYRFKISFDWINKKLVIYALTFLLLGFLAKFSNLLDKWLIKEYMSIKNLGIYYMTFAFVEFLPFVLKSINKIFAPIISEIWEQKKLNELHVLYRFFTKWTLLLSYPMIFFIIFFSNDLLLLFGPEFVLGKNVLIILSIAHAFSVSFGSVRTLLQMTDHHIKIFLVTIFKTLIVILLLFILVPKYQMEGAAFSLAAGIIINNILNYILLYRNLKFIPYSSDFWKVFMTIIFASILLYLSFNYMSNFIPNMNWYWLIFSIVYIYIVTIILSRILCFSKQDKEVVMNLLDKIKK